MSDAEFAIATNLFVAGLIGLAVGIEREWSGHASGPLGRFAGVRTFLILGLTGGVAGSLAVAVIDQLSSCRNACRAAFRSLVERLAAYPVAQSAAAQLTALNGAIASNMLTMAQRVVSSTTTFAVALGIVVFVGMGRRRTCPVRGWGASDDPAGATTGRAHPALTRGPLASVVVGR